MRIIAESPDKQRLNQQLHDRRILLWIVIFLFFLSSFAWIKAVIFVQNEDLVLPVILDGQTYRVNVDENRLMAWTCQVLPALCDGRLDPQRFSVWPPFTRNTLDSPFRRPFSDGEEEVRAWIDMKALATYVEAVNPEIWFVGSSRVQRGIDVQQVEHLLRASGRQWSVVNLAVPGGGIETTLSVIRHFTSNGALPRYIVYPLGAFEINEHYISPVLTRYFMSVGDFTSHIGNVFWSRGIDIVARYYLSNVRHRLLENWDLPTIKDAREAMLFLPKKQWRAALERLRFVSPKGIKWIDVLQSLHRPATPLDLQVLLQSLPRREDPTLNNYHIGNDKRRALFHLLALCRNEGIRIIFTDTPVSSWQHSALVDGPGERFREFMLELSDHNAVWLPIGEEAMEIADEDFVGVRRGREFLDPDHLNRKGAQKFGVGIYRYVLSPVISADTRQ